MIEGVNEDRWEKTENADSVSLNLCADSTDGASASSGNERFHVGQMDVGVTPDPPETPKCHLPVSPSPNSKIKSLIEEQISSLTSCSYFAG